MLQNTNFVKLKNIWQYQHSNLKSILNLYFKGHLENNSQEFLREEYAFYVGLLKIIFQKIEEISKLENLSVDERIQVLSFLIEKQKTLNMFSIFASEFLHCNFPEITFFEMVLQSEIQEFEKLEIESIRESLNENLIEFLQTLFLF